MATFNSVEYAKLVASPPQKLATEELAGRVRTAKFSYTTTGEAVSDIVNLTKLPSGARVIAILVNVDALSSSTGTAGASIGDSGDADRLVTADNWDAAKNGLVALRKGANLGTQHKYTAETVITATVTGEAWASAKDVRGDILYVVD